VIYGGHPQHFIAGGARWAKESLAILDRENARADSTLNPARKNPGNPQRKPRNPPLTGFRNGRFFEIPPILSGIGTKFEHLRVPMI